MDVSEHGCNSRENDVKSVDGNRIGYDEQVFDVEPDTRKIRDALAHRENFLVAIEDKGAI
jgi:hypothetical protein